MFREDHSARTKRLLVSISGNSDIFGMSTTGGKKHRIACGIKEDQMLICQVRNIDVNSFQLQFKEFNLFIASV